MRILIKLLSPVIVLLLTAITTNAQVSTTATSTATIVTPIAISKTADMNFGNIAVNTALGTVVLTPAGTRTATGGATLPATNGTVTAAAFAVTGLGSYTYAITIPSTDYTITRVSGSETMVVNTFTSTPSGTGALSSGSQTLSVGATLNVSASQVAGTYTNGTGFTVTVNYN
ncbi:MAG: DUF4402 domain-containing protein [Mariniphaga sp.]|nr:DUF4402 domain-containing protein [Mariniphaga sp.]